MMSGDLLEDLMSSEGMFFFCFFAYTLKPYDKVKSYLNIAYLMDSYT